MELHPYLTFSGECEEALTFYRDCLGGDFEINRFRDGPDEMGGTTIPGNFKNRVMHMTWRFDGNVVMASDSIEPVPTGGSVTLFINMDSPEALDATFERLAEGGTVTLPPEDTFWRARFGTLTDRYGTRWMLNCSVSR